MNRRETHEQQNNNVIPIEDIVIFLNDSYHELEFDAKKKDLLTVLPKTLIYNQLI